MRDLVHRIYWLLVVLFVSGCSGGGCSGCGGGALQPIPGGYPITPETRIPRSAQLRLTQAGLSRVQAIAPGLLGGFVGSGIPVPTVSQNLTVGRVRICPSGNCRINISLPSNALTLGFGDPNKITANVRVNVQGTIPLQACVGIGCSDSCGGTLCGTIASPDIVVNTMMGSHAFIGLRTAAQISRDTHAQRLNYHRADLVSPTGSGDPVQETPGEGIEDADITCTGSWICGIVNLLRGTIIGQFRGQIAGALGPITDALAMSSMPNPPGCPTGTTANGNRCRYPDGSNVPMLLGTDMRGDLGAMLAGVTPGARAPVSLMLAAGDPMRDGQVINGGMTINVFGAFQSGGHNACVPRVTPPAIPTIPEWSALRGNAVPGTMTAMDFGLGISEDYMNYAAWHLWDSGMFCLAIGTNLSQTLAAGTLTILPGLQSLRQVLFPSQNGPVSIALRPQVPPSIRVGSGRDVMTDPLLTIRLNRTALDWYTFTEERYVRFMTLTTDLVVKMNLQVDREGLRPQIGGVTAENITVSNSQLLSGDTSAIGAAVQAILQPAIMMATGGINPIRLPNINVPGGPMGRPLGAIAINIPTGGVQGVSEGMSRFLGIFAGLQFTPAGTMPDRLELDTEARLEGLDVNPEMFRSAQGFRAENLPVARVNAATPNDFGREVEYSWRVDGGTWSTFAPGAQITVRDWALATPGRHAIEVRARVASEPETADASPARFEVVVDPVGPEVRAWAEPGFVVAEATDALSPELSYAVQFDAQPVSAWGAEARFAVPEGARRAKVLVRDGSGNVTEQSVVVAIIRGGPSTDAGGGCGCAVPGRVKGSNGLLALVATALFGASIARRRRRAGFAATALVAAAGVAAQGCAESAGGSQGDGSTPITTPDAGPTDTGPGACGEGQQRCESSGMCVAPPSDCGMCMPGTQAGTPMWNASSCSFTCACEALPALNPGAVGSHLDMAIGADGTTWLAAYSPGSPSDNQRYGDLVVGRYASETSQVDWQHVDGVPADGMITNDPRGWRGGNSTPGDDVGRFASIAVGAAGPRVAYWDTTNNKLKFASATGTMWSTHTVDADGANGRYASLLLLSNGTPVIAYRATSVNPMGQVSSLVRIARANSPTPTRASDWTISEAASLPSACRAGDCATGTACRESTGRCEATGGACMPACGSGQACFAGSCGAVRAANYVEGLAPGVAYINLVADMTGRLAVVFYHRDRGNLLLAQSDMSGRFAAPVILDGEGAMNRDTGDRGIYASAAYGTDGTLHVAYVDGWEERLMYLPVRGGTPMGQPEVIDDGAGVGTTPFDDGKHLVGDSASIGLVEGTLRVVYQDSTAGTLRTASRGMMGWTRSVADMMDHTGYWARLRGGRVATWYRNLSNAEMRRWGVRVTPLR